MWYIIGIRRDNRIVMSATAQDRYGAMMMSFAMVLAGADVVDMYYHEEGSFGMF